MSVCENFVFIIPSNRNCLALMPSFATTLGLTCGGGLVRVDMYMACCGCLGWSTALLIIWVSHPSVSLKCLFSFSFASSIRIFMSNVSSVIWLSKASFNMLFICISSMSSKRNATALMVFPIGLVIPDITAI